MRRRDFARLVGAGALAPSVALPSPARIASRPAGEPVGYVKAVFAYPPTESLRREGYYSWPGSSFEAEARHREYAAALEAAARRMNLRLEVEPRAIDSKEDAERFARAAVEARPDGLLLIPLKKSHADYLPPILEATGLPAVIFTTAGVLLNPQIREFQAREKVHVVVSLDNVAAAAWGLRLIQARRRMADSTIVDLAGERRDEFRVPTLGTRVVRVPLADFYDLFARTSAEEPDVRHRAARYLREAVRLEEPNERDVLEAAKCYSVLKRILERERGDAVMMTCLPGLRHPRRHVPPCMGFMDLRDEGIPAGCESDLDATLTLMLLEYLFDKPGFQHNPSADTERKLYFGAHCTSPTRLWGRNGPAERYVLRSHAEAGWGCVPQVLLSVGQRVTFAKLHSKPTPPEMVIYSGTIAGCPANPPAGGCRTNVEVKVDGLEDPAEVKSHHLCLCYGDHAAALRSFCRLHGLKATA